MTVTGRGAAAARRAFVLGAVVLSEMLAGCALGPAPQSATGPTVTVLPTGVAPTDITTDPVGPATAGAPGAAIPGSVGGTASAATPGSCRASGSGVDVLPDPRCTPGALNPAVTPATIAGTICATGWTSTVRPPERVTEALKRSQMEAYGYTGRIGSYEEDHLVPLELGGAPADPRNLWPEPGASPNPKDRVEDAARRAVCDGRMALAAAQRAMAGNWVALGTQLGVR